MATIRAKLDDMESAPFFPELRGNAAGAREVFSNSPLQLIAHPLYAPRFSDPHLRLEPWQVPVTITEGDNEGIAPFEVPIPGGRPRWARHAFRNMLAQHAEFAIANRHVLVDLGIPAAWLRDQTTRDKARKLLELRRWWSLLDFLRYKENSDRDMIGLRDISAYHQTLTTKEEADPNSKELRVGSTLKLRKAIEFLTIVEVVVRERFWRGNLIERFRRVSIGGDPNDGSFVWDAMWLEPVIYSISPRPRPGDVNAIVEAAALSRFEDKSGQKSAVLFRVLAGAPCTWRTAKAAAELCTEFYK